MQEKFFSIIVVSLNPGRKLEDTLASVTQQTFADYEVIVKDGGSSDGSLEGLKESGFLAAHPQFRVIEKKDGSIYEGMNQALEAARGSYVQFLNCGDLLYGPKVLEETASAIRQEEARRGERLCIYYGDQYNRRQKTRVVSAPVINDFTCYRNVPCHQVCFYDRRLFAERAYDLRYTVRADYEHFLYSIYEKGAAGRYLAVTVVSYEGGGFSETEENRRRSAGEHREITLRYLGHAKVRKYRLLMWLTLAPLRSRIAESPGLSGAYQKLKAVFYRR